MLLLRVGEDGWRPSGWGALATLSAGELTLLCERLCAGLRFVEPWENGESSGGGSAEGAILGALGGLVAAVSRFVIKSFLVRYVNSTWACCAFALPWSHGGTIGNDGCPLGCDLGCQLSSSCQLVELVHPWP